MMSRNLSKDELKCGIKLLGYERDMLIRTAEWLRPYSQATTSSDAVTSSDVTRAAGIVPGTLQHDRFLVNVMLESFLVHARAIIDFLYLDKSNYDDDIFAADYFSKPGEWKKLRGEKTTLIKETKTRANKMLAHISLYRRAVTPEAKGWEVVRIAGEIDRVLQVFDESRTA